LLQGIRKENFAVVHGDTDKVTWLIEAILFGIIKGVGEGILMNSFKTVWR
jgi:hypothetical protein